MKMSDFLINKKVKFVDGKMIEEESNLNGEITFYNFDYDRFEQLNDEVVSKMNDEDSKAEFVYKLITYVSDLENDITLKQFISMTKMPTSEFLCIYSALIDIIDNIFNSVEQMPALEDRINKINSKIPATEEQIIKNKQQIKEELFQELFKYKDDKEKRKEIFRKISDLGDE